ncbi:MAG: CRISPR system precrRNA processing endoribonuclease RAMP protein Cas6 [Chloroflexota bacterium]|nr:CRISPR system precrRNA processing endoribonuclease RAMP protein Cas6 [Chloroflexota bacterium]
MLTSLVVRIEAVQSGTVNGGTGRAVHGFWYHHWGQIASAVADQIHQAAETPPFTLSPIMDIPYPRRGKIHIEEGESAWFRVVALSESLSRSLTETWAPQLPDLIELAGLPWQIKNWTISPDEHPWAEQVSYKQLGEEHLFLTKPPQSWQIEFVTPTTFHGIRGHFPFPLPDSLVSSWLRRWQAFAPIGLPEELPEQVRQHVVVSSYRLKTVPVRHGKRLTVGCVGRYKLHAIKMHPANRATLDTLAHYAFFVGSGHRTTQGMGMTRLHSK